MGNKDARGREKKKPKKVKAERIVLAPPPRIVRETPEKKAVTPARTSDPA
jgi:hypothetical protein